MHEVALHFLPEGYRFSVAGRDHPLEVTSQDDALLVRLGERSFRVRAVRDGADWHLFRDGAHRVLRLRDEHDAQTTAEISGSLAAPMPGKVLQVLVEPGAAVARGAPLLILEAMKMEHTITAPHAGRVAEIRFKAGEQVQEGAELVRLEQT